MKKHNALYIVLITFLILALLTWFIPITYYSNGFTTDNRMPIGLGNLFSYPIYTFYNFIYVFIYLLFVGGLFGLLKKIPAYRVILDGIANKIKNHEKLFVILTVLLTSIIVSLTGFTYEILVLLPFISALVYLVGYDKLTTSMLLVGSIISGVIGNTYSNVIVGKILSFTGSDYNELIIVKAILLVLSSALVITFTLLHMKKVKDGDIKLTESVFLPKKVSNDNVKVWPLKITLCLSFLIMVISAINWNTAFNISIFDDFLTNMNTVLLFNKYILLVIFGLYLVGSLLKYFVGKRKGKETNFIKSLGKCGFIFFIVSALIVVLVLLKLFLEDIFGVTKVFTNIYDKLGFNEIKVGTILGGFTALGTWVYNQFIMWLLIVILLVKMVSHVNFSEAFDSIFDGMKNNVRDALVCVLSYSFLILLSNHPFIMTGFKHLFKTNSSGAFVYNNLTFPLTTFASGLMNTDFNYYEYGVFTLQDSTAMFTDTSLYGIMGLATQGMYGLAMLIAPSSVSMLYCLSSLDISYKEWWKNIWKLFLALLALLLITFMIVLLVS